MDENTTRPITQRRERFSISLLAAKVAQSCSRGCEPPEPEHARIFPQPRSGDVNSPGPRILRLKIVHGVACRGET